jgi:glycosyltransferase involved in cell wall biosynthesis
MRIVRYYPRAVVGDGGITSSVWHSSRALAAAGQDAVVAFDEGAAPGSPDGVVWWPVRHTGWPWAVPRGLDELLEGADVVVLHSAWCYHNLRAGRVARSRGIPYVLEPRGAYDPAIVSRKRWEKRAWWLLWERRLVMNARAIHVFFDSQRDHLAALGWDGPVVVAPNGVEDPGVRWDGGSGGYLLWYGRFDPEHKGIDLLLEAMRLLPPETRVPLRLHGPDSRARKKDEIRRRVHALGLHRWVTVGEPIHGREKMEILSRAAGFVYPSRWEAFGNAAAEAAAAGVPTLVTPYPLGRHLAGRGAAVLAEADPASLAEGLIRLTRPEAAGVGARAAALVAKEFSWEGVTRRWLDQVESLV